MKFTSFAQLLLSAAVLTKTVSAGKNGNSIHEAPVETHNADGQACKVKYNDNNSRYFKVNGHEVRICMVVQLDPSFPSGFPPCCFQRRPYISFFHFTFTHF